MARARKPKTCVKCGAAGLWWKSFDGSWRLSDSNGSLHVCDPAAKVLNADKPAGEPMQDEPCEPAVAPASRPAEHGSQAAQTDAGKAFYQLVKPHIEADFAGKLANQVPVYQPNNLIVMLPGEQEPVAIVEGAHKQCAELTQYLSLGLNVMLVGPAGSGKTQAAEHAAEALGLKFFPQSVGAQTSKTDLLGYIDAHGRPVRTILREAYEHGGLFLLDEIDAGNANVLTILNAALANAYCSFPDAVVHKHADFRLVAAGNTYGHGASRQYVGRNQLDAATLNRFVVIDWDYDVNLEHQLGQAPWVEYVHSLRCAQASTGVRVIISTRAIVYGDRMLKAGISRETVEQAVIWAAVSADDKGKLLSARRY